MVLFVVALVPIVAFLAFAIDVGMLTVAQTQLRDAADASALAGCRALNGDVANNNNYSGVAPAAQTALTGNRVLGSSLQASQVSLNIGRYTYNSTTEQFEGQFPGTAGNWNMVRAVVTTNVTNSLAFGRVFSFSLPNYQATATAVHRARDIALILDYSGSMRFSSLMGLPYYGARGSNNQDTIYPLFGHYAGNSALIQGPSPTTPYADCNVSTTTSDGRPPIVRDFYTNSSGSPAFAASPVAYATAPDGDQPAKENFNAGPNHAKTLAELLNIPSPTSSTVDATWEAQGYAGYNLTSGTGFAGYTTGPGYWGKTFFLWPPDPTKDWRTLYFLDTSTGLGVTDSRRLWDSSGNWQMPGPSTYQPNYTAILHFIKHVGPNPFPPRLQSGRILYYDAIPDSIDTSSWPPADMNERFWKDYIDYVLGYLQTTPTYYVPLCDGNTSLSGYGGDFAWGSPAIHAMPSGAAIDYRDNPKRPLLHFWFGPLSMIDFLGNYNVWENWSTYYSYCNWLPGTCHEAPLYACKLGINAALTDIKNNHPSDYVSLIMFACPRAGATDTLPNRFNRVRVPLSQNYDHMRESLWYPPSTIGNSSATIRPYDADNDEVPRALGGTCYAMALMLAYNQFSCNASLQTYNQAANALPGDAGGMGRKGAQKIIIFETDGSPTSTARVNHVNNGSYQSYYPIRYNAANLSGSEYPAIRNYGSTNGAVVNQIYQLCGQLAAADTANGYSTPNKPLLIHCLAFGPLGASTTAILDQMQTIGNVSDGMPSYKVINGNSNTIIANLQTAIERILQDGVQVSLVE